MKAVIPAKMNSTRVPMKNYRPFYEGKSLVDILVEKLLRVLPPWDIYLSCEDVAVERVAERYGIAFLPRDTQLTHNETPLTDLVRGICADVPGTDDVMWCECIDPLFNWHRGAVNAWKNTNTNERYDSLVVIHRDHGYHLDERMNPIGWGFGPWHVPSQRLPLHYRFNFTCSILTRESIQRCGYMIGAHPLWFTADSQYIDIDTEEDFRLAQIVYAASAGDATIT